MAWGYGVYMPQEPTSLNRGFISYTRADNETFGQVVNRLKADLTGQFQAQTGRTLELFLDRDSIGWGEDWRQTIRTSVQAATVFIPVVTMRFFTQATPAARNCSPSTATRDCLVSQT